MAGLFIYICIDLSNRKLDRSILLRVRSSTKHLWRELEGSMDAMTVDCATASFNGLGMVGFDECVGKLNAFLDVIFGMCTPGRNGIRAKRIW